ncbi:MAG: DUF1015 domain-containing protein [Myxococcota bacterium]
MKLHPFQAIHPAPGRAAEVVSPPYDVISTAEARALAEGKPCSFLHVIRPEIGLEAGVDVHADEVYEQGAKSLERLIAEGALQRDDAAAVWLYRLDMGAVTQVGFVGCAEVDDYAEGRIKKHEFTRPDKEDDRTRHVDTLGAHTGPVFLTCRDSGALTTLQGRYMKRAPDVDVVGYGEVRHRLWRIVDAGALAEVAAAFEPVEAFYIADGHHRAASAWRVRDLRDERAGGRQISAPWQRFLVVVFPDTQVKVLAYNRVVADLNGMTPEAFLDALGVNFEVGAPGASPEPTERHQFGLYLDGAWRGLTAKAHLVDESDPVARLDVAILQTYVLAPLLGIEDPRRDARVSFVGGIRGSEELARRVDASGAGCAFAMFPTSVDELLAVADVGLVMPPKSTWFEPKLGSGLLVNPIDG